MIDYKIKLTTNREFYPIKDLNISCESDRGRIISAPALRRLQKKTQVFPLELNAAVRSRLTHSLEVSQTARYIAKTILSKLDLKELETAFISTAEMTSLLHDIGNPPFGHFAEMAINTWSEKNLEKILDKNIHIKKEKSLKEKLLNDLKNFDGNAQAIRVITKLQRLNLSYSQIASVIKYTRCAYEKKPTKDEKKSYLKKKPGFYYSEENLVKKIQFDLNIEEGNRFPITYIMEAADDISYLNADIEDAVDKGILNLELIYKLIQDECEKENEEYLLKLVNSYYHKVKENEEEPYQFNLFLTLVRAKMTSDLVNYVSETYIKNHQKIFDGSFNNALLEANQNSKYTKAINILQRISIKHIYNNKDIQTLELKGHKILTSLLDIYSVLLEQSANDFEDLIDGKRVSCYLSQRLLRRMSSKHIVAYKNELKNLDKKNHEFYILHEWYYRVRLLLDYISGMTDDYALNEYKTLNALDY